MNKHEWFVRKKDGIWHAIHRNYWGASFAEYGTWREALDHANRRGASHES